MSWRKVSAAYWLSLYSCFFVWLCGWALQLWSWVPGPKTITALVGSALLIEAVALVNPEPGDTLSEVNRWLGRMKLLFPWSWGIIGGAGLLLGVAALLPAPVELPVLRAAAIVTVLAGLSGHFWLPPGTFSNRFVTMPYALLFGTLHGFLVVLSAVFVGGAVLLFAVAAAAIVGGALYFVLPD